MMNKYEDAEKWIDEIWTSSTWSRSDIVWCITADRLRELIKKETPMKPHLEGDGYSNGELVYDTWVCPNCEKHYEVDYDKYDYCPNCGQRLEYEDE